MDLLPTVLDIVGFNNKVPESVEGGSLLPLLRGRNQVDRKVPGFVFRYSKSHYHLDIAMVQGKYKLLKDLETQKIYLWDLSKDIGEELYLSSEKPDLAADMYKTMSEYFNHSGWNESMAVKTTKINNKK